MPGENEIRQELLALASRYHGSAVLLAAAELSIFDALSVERGAGAGQVAKEIAADERAVEAILNALAAVEVIDKREERFFLRAAYAPFLTSTGSQTLNSMLRHQANCLRRWSELAAVAKTGTPAECRPSILGEEEDLKSFIEAMDNLSAPIAEEVVRGIEAPPFSRLLDVGGASGSWTIAWLKRQPAARAVLFDLPEVLPRAQARLSPLGLLERVDLVGGDFTRDPLPQGFDLAWLSAIAHQQSRAENLALYKKIFSSLNPGGSLFIRDVVMDDAHISPPYGALFAINMLVATATGGTFSLREFDEDLRGAGFSGGARLLRKDPGMHSIVAARKE